MTEAICALDHTVYVTQTMRRLRIYFDPRISMLSAVVGRNAIEYQQESISIPPKSPNNFYNTKLHAGRAMAVFNRKPEIKGRTSSGAMVSSRET